MEVVSGVSSEVLRLTERESECSIVNNHIDEAHVPHHVFTLNNAHLI